MSGLTCTFVPNIGKNLMNELKKQFGYNVAKTSLRA